MICWRNLSPWQWLLWKWEKGTISIVIATVAKRIKYFIKNINLLHSKYDWQNWVDWITAMQQKFLQPDIGAFSVKGPKSFCPEDWAQKQGWLADLINWKCQYICMPYFSWHKVFFRGPQIKLFLNLNSILVIIKLAEGLEILLSWPWRIPLSMQLTYFWEKFVTASWNNINHFSILKYLYLSTLLSFQLYHAD